MVILERDVKVQIKNLNYFISAWTILEIDRKYKGFGLRGLEVCKHCKIGQRIAISRVEPNALMVLEKEADKK